VNVSSWIFVCPKCKQHTRVVLVMPRLSPTAECVACNVQMVNVGAHTSDVAVPQDATPWTEHHNLPSLDVPEPVNGP